MRAREFVIKINPAVPTQSTSKSRQARKADGTFLPTQTSTRSPNLGGPVNAVATLGALLELQGRHDTNQEENLDWSADTLDLLEDLHRAVVTDNLTDKTLQALRTTLARQNPVNTETFHGPLQDLQAQIALRVRVELAKRGLD